MRTKVRAHLVRELRFMDVERTRVECHDRKCEKHGVEWYVAATQIKKPRHLIEHRSNKATSALLLHFITQSLYFAREGTTCDRVWKGKYWLVRPRWTIGPHLRDKVLCERHERRRRRFVKRATQRQSLSRADQLWVHTHTRMGLHVLDQPFVPCRHARLTCAHQGPHARLELLRRLQKVAAVRKEECFFESDQSTSCRAIESSNVATQ